MTSSVSSEPTISMAAYLAAASIHEYLSAHPEADISGAIGVLRNTDSDFSFLDFVNGANLYSLVSEELCGQAFDLRSTLSCIVKRVRPWWLHAVPYGRKHLAEMLQPDEYQCFREAGLLSDCPDEEAVALWDELSALERAEQDVETMVRARHAERLSMRYERERLQALGVERSPEWVALDDNTLGFDIRSYDVREGRLVHHLIEVKSTQSGRIHVSRNEWRNAKSASRAYSFYVWWWPDMSMSIVSVDTIAESIPEDRGRGEWQDAEVSVL